MNRPTTAVILSAGASTRTLPLTVDRPKPMLPVLNKPLLQHTLDQLVGLVEHAVLIVGFERQQIISYFGNSYKSIQLDYCVQHQRLGTGHALLQAMPLLEKAFFVLNGDDLVHHNDLERMACYNFAVLGAVVPDPRQFGVLQIIDDHLESIVEKPTYFSGQPLVNTGVFVFQSEILTALRAVNPSVRGEYELVDAFHHLPENIFVKVLHINEYWKPIGFPWKLLETNLFFLERMDIDTPVLSGVTVIDPVLIGPGTRIEPDVTLGSGVIIGSNCVVESGTRLENCLVMNNVHIGSGCSLSESIISDNVIIGSNCQTIIQPSHGETVLLSINDKMIDTGRKSLGAIFGSGALVGDDCRLAAGVRLWPKTMTSSGTLLQDDVLGV